MQCTPPHQRVDRLRAQDGLWPLASRKFRSRNPPEPRTPPRRLPRLVSTLRASDQAARAVRPVCTARGDRTNKTGTTTSSRNRSPTETRPTGTNPEAAGRYVPVLLNDIKQAMQFGGPHPADAEILDRTWAPMLRFTDRIADPSSPLWSPWRTTLPPPGSSRSPVPGTPRPLTHPEALAAAPTTVSSSAQRPA
jgi:hypothetical protein